MQMLTALFGSLRGVFSKTYLLAGLLPAAVILVSWEWYVRGEALGVLIQEDEIALAAALTLAVKLFGLGLLFYVVHQPLLRFFEDIPVFKELRQYMMQRQLEKWYQATQEYDLRDWELTAVGWPQRGFKDEDNYVPSWVKQLAPQKVYEASQRAMRALQRVITPTAEGTSVPSEDDINTIVQGLCQLLELSRRDPTDVICQAQKADWAKLYKESVDARFVLQYIYNRVYRLWVEVQQVRSAFPQDTRWMKPTALGNRIAVLDDYAETRYGITTSTLWARLWAVIQEDDRKNVANAQLMVHMLLNLSVACVFTSIIITIDSLWTWRLASLEYEILELQINWPALVCIALAVILSRVFYLSAVAGFRSVQEHVIRLVDLHRGSLIAKLGFQAPKSLSLEKQFFTDLTAFFTDGTNSMQNWPCLDAPVASSVVGQKLLNVSVQRVMLPRNHMVLLCLRTASDHAQPIVDLLELLSRAQQSTLLILNDQGYLIYVIPKGELERFLAQKTRIGIMAVPQLHALSLKDLLDENPSLRLLFQSNIVTVSPDTSLAEAQKAMDTTPNCLDVFITENGKQASPLVGWITNVQIAEAMRA